MNMPPVTKNLIIINLLFFLAKLVAVRYGVDLDNLLGLHFFLAPDFNFYQFFTYMFMHGGVTHILFNMFAVWMFGRVMESYWGGRRFLLYYVVCGLGAGLGEAFGATGAAGAASATGACVLFSSFICISPCHVLMLNIIDCRTKKGGGPDWIRRPWRFAMRCG